jgi:hypothetical protein
MPTTSMRRRLSLNPATLLVILAVGIVTSGCATAGMAAVSPIVGAIWSLGDRSILRTLPADQSTTFGATADALARMGVQIDHTEKSGDSWQLTGTGEGTTVHAGFERVTARMTRVTVRVETGGVFADKRTADEILNQISASLAALTAVERDERRSDGSVERLGALQREIERLGAKIDDSKRPTSVERPAAVEHGVRPAVSPAFSSDPVIVIPTSVGVTTVPVPPAPVAIEPAPPRVRHEERRVERSTSVTAPPTAARRDGAADIFAAPLTPVETLRPVEGLATRPASQ